MLRRWAGLQWEVRRYIPGITGMLWDPIKSWRSGFGTFTQKYLKVLVFPGLR